MKANVVAWELSHKLFDLVGEFKALVIALNDEASLEANSQADAVACELAGVLEKISGPTAKYDLFCDLASDPKDRRFSLEIPR